MNFRETLERIDFVVAYAQFTFFVPIILISFILHIAWSVYLIRYVRKSIRLANREIGDSNDEMIVTNHRINARKGKLMLFIFLFEFISVLSYLLSSCYHLIGKLTPNLSATAKPINASCLNHGLQNRLWIDGIQYPLVSLLLSMGRAAALLGMGIGDHYLQFVANTYVVDEWKYKHINASCISAIFLSFFILIAGNRLETIVLSQIICVIALFVYIALISKRLSFISNKALEWREQDMSFNVSVDTLRAYSGKKRTFRLFGYILILALFGLFSLELAFLLESTLEQFLFYGKCIFPIVYGFEYVPPLPLLNSTQLTHFISAQRVISISEMAVDMFVVSVLFLPYFIYSLKCAVSFCVEVMRFNSLSMRYTGTRSLID